ncbi:unnamed protein product [Trichobilharzia szidati]|nr:unnamed protein product [Trichobilharzia szidati]
MPLSLLPPVYPNLKNQNHQLDESTEKVSSAASEAALHRRRLNELRQSFLGLPTSADDRLSHSQTTVPTCVNLNTDDSQPVCTSRCGVLDPTRFNSYNPSLSHSTPDIGHLSFNKSNKSVNKNRIINQKQQSVLSIDPTISCDQLDATDQLPSPEYFSFVYSSNPSVSCSEYLSTESSLSGTLTAKPNVFVNKSNLYPLTPETVHLSSEECAESSSSSSSSSNGESFHEYVVSDNDDNINSPKSSINISSLTDVKWLSEQCKKNDTYPHRFLSKNLKPDNSYSKKHKTTDYAEYNPRLFHAKTDATTPFHETFSSPKDSNMSDQVNNCNQDNNQSDSLCKQKKKICFMFTDDEMQTCASQHQKKCTPVMPVSLSFSTTNSSHNNNNDDDDDESQLHSPAKSMIGRCFSVSPNHRLSNSLSYSHISLNNTKVSVPINANKLECTMNNSSGIPTNKSRHRINNDNNHQFINHNRSHEHSLKKKMSSETLSGSDIQDMYLHSYKTTSKSHKQRNEKDREKRTKNDRLFIDCSLEHQDNSSTKYDSTSECTDDCDKVFSQRSAYEQPSLWHKEVKNYSQNNTLHDISHQGKQLFTHMHSLRCTDEDAMSYETSLSSLPSSAWSSLCPGDTSLISAVSHNRLKVPLPGLAGAAAADNSSEYSVRESTSHHSNSNRNSESQNSNYRSKHLNRRSNSGFSNDSRNTTLEISGSSSYQSFSPPYVNVIPPARSSDLSSGFPSSENLSVNRNICKTSKRASRPSSDHSGAYQRIRSMETRSLHKGTSRHNSTSTTNKRSTRTFNPIQLSKGSSVSQRILSESSSTLSVNNPDDINAQNAKNHSDNYYIAQSDNHTQEYDYLPRKGPKVSTLAAKISHYLENGREAEVRRFLNKMLRKPESRRVVDELIQYCGNNLQRLLDPNVHSITPQNFQNNSTSSLLHLAASLSDLRTSYMPGFGTHRNRRGSCGSVLSNPWNFTSYDRSWVPAAHNWSTLDRSYKLSPFQGKSISSLNSSTNTVRFIKWPSDGYIERKPPILPPPPPPVPPVLLKTTILPCDQRIHIVDTHALEATNRIHTTFSELISDLTTGINNEVEVVRSLYRWTTGKDTRFEDYDQEAPSDSLIGMLRQMKYNQLSRNEMFYELCRYVGLHCQYITGYSKGAGYRPGMSIRENHLFRNTWLAVYICDGWRFVNCNWGARYLTENVLDSRSNVPPDCDEFYFLTDPEQHVFENLPDLKVWQLLRKPLSINRFCHLPLLKSPFFNANLSLKRNYSDCLITKNGQVSIKIKMSKFVGISCSLENCADHSILLGLCLVEVLLRPPEVVRIQAAPSQPGKYYLNVYVSPDWRREDVRELACSFQIHCSEYNYSRLVVTGRLPEVGFLGRTPASQVHGVIMVPEGDASDGRPYIVHNDPRPLKIPFAIAPGLKLCHQLKSFDRPGNQMADCDSYALLQMKPSHQCKLTDSKPFGSQANGYYCVRLPIQAFYYLTIYASNENDILKDHLECVYRILIDARNCRSAELTHAYPRQTFWWVQCRLIEPSHQHLFIDRSYKFCLDAPQCDSVAVVINDTEWHFLTPSSSSSASDLHGRWSGKIYTGKCLGQLSVFGRIPHINKPKKKCDDNESRISNNSIQQNRHQENHKDGNNFNHIATMATRTTTTTTTTDEVDGENSYIKLLDYVLIQKE